MATLTVNEAAAELGVRPARVRELIRHGKLEASHHPTAYVWMIERRALRRYIQQRKPARGRRRNVDATEG